MGEGVGGLVALFDPGGNAFVGADQGVLEFGDLSFGGGLGPFGALLGLAVATGGALRPLGVLLGVGGAFEGGVAFGAYGGHGAV